MSSHRIRLAGPWEWQDVSEINVTSAPSEVRRCQLPFPSEHEDMNRDGLLLRRRFHCPTGIESTTSVSVTIEVQNCIPEVRLNDQILKPVENPAIPNLWRFDIAGLLRPFNELRVRLVPICPDAEFRLNTAALEIHEPE